MENLHNLPLDYNAEIALQKFKSNKVGKLSVILDSNRYIENHEQFLNYTTNMTTKNKGTKKPRKNEGIEKAQKTRKPKNCKRKR